MNCEETQRYLSDLLDGSLDVECAEAIKDHLGACSLCADEVASLAECQRLVSSLPTIEPPVNFTRRVMTEIREQAKPPSFWERFGLPFRAHVPAQATAVILIAVLAAAIYLKEPPKHQSAVGIQTESSSQRHEETDKAALSPEQPLPARSGPKQVTDEINAKGQESKDSAQPKEPQLPRQPEEPQKSTVSNHVVTPEGSPSQAPIRPPATPAPLQDKSSVASEALSSREEQLSSSTREATVPQTEKEKSSTDAAVSARPFLAPEARPQGSSITSSLSAQRTGSVVGLAPSADYELAIRLKDPGRDDKALVDRLSSGGGQSERRSLISQEEAKILDHGRQQTIQTGNSQIIWVTVARNLYESFKKELADLGNIEAESSIPERKRDADVKSSDQLRIKVTFLPPVSSGSPKNSEPSGR